MKRPPEAETDVELWFVEELETHGWMTIKGDRVRRGFSDQFCFGPGKQVEIIEFKREDAPRNRRGEKLQDYYREQFADMGFHVHKVRGIAEAEMLLNVLVRRTSMISRKRAKK